MTALVEALRATTAPAKFSLKLSRDYKDESRLYNLLAVAADKNDEVTVLRCHLEPDDEAMFSIEAVR